MDKLTKKVAIRARQVKQPIVFVCNMPTTHFKVVGDRYYQPLMKNFYA